MFDLTDLSVVLSTKFFVMGMHLIFLLIRQVFTKVLTDTCIIFAQWYILYIYQISLLHYSEVTWKRHNISNYRQLHYFIDSCSANNKGNTKARMVLMWRHCNDEMCVNHPATNCSPCEPSPVAVSASLLADHRPGTNEAPPSTNSASDSCLI